MHMESEITPKNKIPPTILLGFSESESFFHLAYTDLEALSVVQVGLKLTTPLTCTVPAGMQTTPSP